MNERRSHVDRYLAGLEMAYSLVGGIDSVESVSTQRLSEVAVHAKRVEMKLAAAMLADAEFRLAALVARRDFLEARCAQGSATNKDIEALNWAIEALPANISAMTELTAAFEALRRELNSLLAQAEDDTERQD